MLYNKPQIFCMEKSTHADWSPHSREEEDLLEILDLQLFGVKNVVSILIDPLLATVILLDSCLVCRKGMKFLLVSCMVKDMHRQSCLILA